MPQMAPVLWLPLFISMLTIMSLTSSYIYFFTEVKKEKLNLNFKSYSTLNWLW